MRSRTPAPPAWTPKISARAARPSWKSANRGSRDVKTRRTSFRSRTINMHKPVETTGNTTPSSQAARLPLSRFKVIDLTLARAGPSCVRTLADWGADVIRVEPPPSDGETDEMMGRRDGSDFQNLHRNKRAVTLNLKTDAGREILLQLAEKADVVI